MSRKNFSESTGRNGPNVATAITLTPRLTLAPRAAYHRQHIRPLPKPDESRPDSGARGQRRTSFPDPEQSARARSASRSTRRAGSAKLHRTPALARVPCGESESSTWSGARR
jgi:hypothetical protein